MEDNAWQCPDVNARAKQTMEACQRAGVKTVGIASDEENVGAEAVKTGTEEKDMEENMGEHSEETCW